MSRLKMGKLIALHPKEIMASKDYLKENTLNYILEFFKTAKNILPPPPIVKKEDNQYVAIDGHNLLAVCSKLDIKCDVYLIEHKNDFLPGKDEVTIKRNNHLKEKYDSKPIISFSDLLIKNSF